MENTASSAPPQPATEEALDAQPRRESVTSENSQTAREYIDAQLQLEADAREALPYSFENCTRPLGPLRQTLFSCVTCNPPPSDPDAPYTPAGVCYSCSICCHGEHTLVELFTKRNFECDCGTSRLPSSSPCALRADENTGVRGVHSENPAPGNKYNQNFRNRFCGCAEIYDPYQEKGTMFQCLGLGTVGTGGCGEDWWHPECLVGLPRSWNNAQKTEGDKEATEGTENKPEDGGANPPDEPPLPPGFPGEDDFESFVCYKCLESNPWLKRYAGTPGFLPPVYKRSYSDVSAATATEQDTSGSKKRKIEDASDDEPEAKRPKEEDSAEPPVVLQREEPDKATAAQKHDSLPAQEPAGVFSLFVKEDFREHLCRCSSCYSNLAPHVQLREEEEVYEPPLSEEGDAANAAGSQHSGSLLERGEAALSNVDRVRAIEGVMVYNHLKDKVKEFLKPYAESGEAVSAEAVKGYFEKLRGDDQENNNPDGEKSADSGGDGGGGDNRREQSGY